MFPITHGLRDGFPRRHRIRPLPPAIPQFLVLAALSRLRDAQSALEMVKYPHSLRPGCEHNVAETEVFAEEIWPFWIGVRDPRLQGIEELGARFVDRIWTVGGVLEEPNAGVRSISVCLEFS